MIAIYIIDWLYAHRSPTFMGVKGDSPMFVIAGVSGNTGYVVADELLARGKKVRVVVRDAAKAAAWRDKGAEIAVA
ncbi:MAG TPA: hypothetical protein VIF62_16000, partial [Labilithrix sp.]